MFLMIKIKVNKFSHGSSFSSVLFVLNSFSLGPKILNQAST